MPSFNLGQGSSSAILLQRSDMTVPGILLGFPAAYGLTPDALGYLAAVVSIYPAIAGDTDTMAVLEGAIKTEPALTGKVGSQPAIDGDVDASPALDGEVESRDATSAGRDSRRS